MRKCHILALAICFVQLGHAQSLGIFTDHSDVGSLLHSGSTTYDPSKNAYTLVGSGENMWATADAFQFAWKKISGDMEISADVSFPNSAGNEHKKAVLMLRQSLDADSVYADVALHGNGLTRCSFATKRAGPPVRSSRKCRLPQGFASRASGNTFTSRSLNREVTCTSRAVRCAFHWEMKRSTPGLEFVRTIKM
jgi:hypothetical protein